MNPEYITELEHALTWLDSVTKLGRVIIIGPEVGGLVRIDTAGFEVIAAQKVDQAIVLAYRRWKSKLS